MTKDNASTHPKDPIDDILNAVYEILKIKPESALATNIDDKVRPILKGVDPEILRNNNHADTLQDVIQTHVKKGGLFSKSNIDTKKITENIEGIKEYASQKGSLKDLVDPKTASSIPSDDPEDAPLKRQNAQHFKPGHNRQKSVNLTSQDTQAAVKAFQVIEAQKPTTTPQPTEPHEATKVKFAKQIETSQYFKPQDTPFQINKKDKEPSQISMS